MNFDFTLLTDPRYVDPTEITPYIENILTEDHLVQKALERKGFNVQRVSWDDKQVDWSKTTYAVFRTTWDYFDRFEEFSIWLDDVSKKTKLINAEQLIRWNIDKHYLGKLQLKGINIPSTEFIEAGSSIDLGRILYERNWDKLIVKPCVSGAARHTYLVDRSNLEEVKQVVNELLEHESMMVQEFQEKIVTYGEVSLMLFGENYSHAVRKKAKSGDFRVQDDHGGTLHDHEATEEEIAFAQACVRACPVMPIYARIDLFYNNDGKIALGELELIEPELWFRRKPESAVLFANELTKRFEPTALGNHS
jgi:glutathione synthase/RimK-type ligase-like ATP-grasp enzyme